MDAAVAPLPHQEPLLPASSWPEGHLRQKQHGNHRSGDGTADTEDNIHLIALNSLCDLVEQATPSTSPQINIRQFILKTIFYIVLDIVYKSKIIGEPYGKVLIKGELI